MAWNLWGRHRSDQQRWLQPFLFWRCWYLRNLIFLSNFRRIIGESMSRERYATSTRFVFTLLHCPNAALLLYGHGVYFSVNVSYAASDTNAAREKHIYYARVLVGETTAGSMGFAYPHGSQAPLTSSTRRPTTPSQRRYSVSSRTRRLTPSTSSSSNRALQC